MEFGRFTVSRPSRASVRRDLKRGTVWSISAMEYGKFVNYPHATIVDRAWTDSMADYGENPCIWMRLTQTAKGEMVYGLPVADIVSYGPPEAWDAPKRRRGFKHMTDREWAGKTAR